MKWAVIGASSFSGGAFCQRLPEGDDVVAISRRDGFDLNADTGAICSVIENQKPDFIVNFAALNVVPDSWKHWEDYHQTNIIGVGKLVRALIDWKIPIRRFVQVSTPEVYGSTTESAIDESAPYNPSTPYAVSRAACDMDLLALHKATGFPVSFTRTVNVYGPRQQAYRLIPKLVLKILRGEKLQLHGGGVSTRSFIHIDDVANFVSHIAIHGVSGEVYHASGSSQIAIRTLVEFICELMGVSFSDAVEVSEERMGKDRAYELNDFKARHSFGWSPMIDFKDGVRATANWILTNQDYYRGHSLEYQHK